jgi:hypothetical protein
MTRERPILFSAPMVRALLEGRKTQTRRLVKMREFQRSDTVGYDFAFRDRRLLWNEYTHGQLVNSKWNRYGAPGDRLWVRETWDYFGGDEYLYQGDPGAVLYRADPGHHDGAWRDRGWRPSIHMPRWASRLTLEVTGVRVERVQGISEEDARAEGLFEWRSPSGVAHFGEGVADTWETSAAAAFARLWDSINGKRAPWSSNPWVWVVEFRRVEAA